MAQIRTRFAPSPTGYLHIGGARTALFSWAFARQKGGEFVLRIEDTDRERSTQASVDAILDGMKWLGLDWDEGPVYQMDRLARYKEVADDLIRRGLAYPCYASKDELDAMREAQRAAGLKPRYDGRWRPENAAGKAPPAGVEPVIRFRNPDDGDVVWHDLVKGTISINNSELDDLVILRADGVPTYNFGVVIDDWDMGITQVIRGDDHVNNTPRQINLLRAIGAPVPDYAHVPMILGHDGERLSKRHGAVSVLQYEDDGYLPEALLNYLARLGWSHGDDEVFSLQQMVEWFDLGHISRSPARFDGEKLGWINQQYLKICPAPRLGELLRPRLEQAGLNVDDGPDVARVADLLRERGVTLNEIADAAHYFYTAPTPPAELVAQHVTDEARPALQALTNALQAADWNAETLGPLIKDTATAHGLKMPKVAMPLRVLVCGTTSTPSIDAVLAVLGRERVLERLAALG
ncbi:MAG: glutamate--tRNA ligase [Betaproteobacteria bacterium]|jgi:glutamyl-tRNA synthetase|nr:glutamate--tRNA ligase [Betaproteobacteria bacterium]NCU94302.1 glutamate--tRNA ligase [Betaproteobacteria bacterium]